MSVLNVYKLSKSFDREVRYFGQECLNIESIDEVANGIDSFIQSSNGTSFLRFLLRQDKEVIKAISPNSLTFKYCKELSIRFENAEKVSLLEKMLVLLNKEDSACKSLVEYSVAILEFVAGNNVDLEDFCKEVARYSKANIEVYLWTNVYVSVLRGMDIEDILKHIEFAQDIDLDIVKLDKVYLENYNLGYIEIMRYLYMDYNSESIEFAKQLKDTLGGNDFGIQGIKSSTREGISDFSIVFMEILDSLSKKIDTVSERVKKYKDIVTIMNSVDSDSYKHVLNLICKKAKVGVFASGLKDIVNWIQHGAYDSLLENSKVNGQTEPELMYDLGEFIKCYTCDSKSFIKQIVKNPGILELVLSIHIGYIKFADKIINIGQLNFKEIEVFLSAKKSLIRYMISSEIDWDCNKKLSFREFNFIGKHIKNNEKIMEYAKGKMHLKESHRYLKLNDYVKIKSNVDNLLFGEENILSYIGDKTLQHCKNNENPLGLEDDTLFLNYMELISRQVVVETSVKLRAYIFLIKEHYGFKNIEKCSEIFRLVLDSKRIVRLMKDLKLSKDFVATNKERFLDFVLSKDLQIAEAFINNYNIDESSKRNISLIIKSIVAGKYDDLKFVYEDVAIETQKQMTKECFNSWRKTDGLVDGAFKISDKSDFNTIMTIGKKPVVSCMHYADGLYSHCLLSNFDTCKKVLTIEKNGVYVGRAILRLTKMKSKKGSDLSNGGEGFGFVDVEDMQTKDNVKKKNDLGEKLILFLERPYTTLDGSEFTKVYGKIVSFLKEKASKIGATLVVSDSYSRYKSCDDTGKEKSVSVFITKSKNGNQYLDSFGGSTSDNSIYKKATATIYN